MLVPDESRTRYEIVQVTSDGAVLPSAQLQIGASVQLASDKLLPVPAQCLTAGGYSENFQFVALIQVAADNTTIQYSLVAVSASSGGIAPIANLSLSIVGRPDATPVFFSVNPANCNYSFVFKSEYPTFDGSLVQINISSGSFSQSDWMPSLRWVTHIASYSASEYIGVVSNGISDEPAA